MNYDADLQELDRIWPLGKQLIVPDGGTVLVAGAYEGRYMHYICTRFTPGRVIGYEPQKDKAAKAWERLAEFGSATVVCEGIGVHTCLVTLERTGSDGCHVANYASATEVRLNSIDNILSGGIGPIDLFICNMEGYEIPLLAYLCATGRISEIKSLAVQFHSANERVASILTAHYGPPVYNDFPTWTYWRL